MTKEKEIMPVDKIIGEIILPGDKSISHRAVILASIAKGRTRIKNSLDCDDCRNTIRAFRDMDIRIDEAEGEVIIEGRGLKGLKQPPHPINVGESGTSMRLLAGVISGQDFSATLEGSGGLNKRPMKRITEPLSMMGVDIKASDGGFPPIVINGGRIKPITYKLPVASAQVKSAILLAGLYADGITCVEENIRSRDHTERALEYFGARVTVDGSKVSVRGIKELSARSVDVPGDMSSAAFFIAAATLAKGSKLKINGVGINPTRFGFINVLLRMGADIEVLNKVDGFEPMADIVVLGSRTRGIVIERHMIPGLIDELPAIFVVAALSKGKTIIRGAEELRVKETDRILSMQTNLKALGARMDILGDDIVIEGVSALKGAALKSFGDHRTCMASVVAALAAGSASVIDETECVNKSFPEFFRALENIAS
ncbi:MAG: 3-phosphoshikimate 1-carboxyvinyltransferase [Candidatus Omnitrophica bacterium]|nr:3-phosphoshikimate 1-carboxyvinyltransferase [Candidatus Omnitrophota bacterium]